MNKNESRQLATSVARLTRENGVELRRLVDTHGLLPAEWTLQLRRQIAARWRRVHQIIASLDAAGYPATGAPLSLWGRVWA
jgi:hypothetical protein